MSKEYRSTCHEFVAEEQDGHTCAACGYDSSHSVHRDAAPAPQPPSEGDAERAEELADTIVQRYLAHPGGSMYPELMAQIAPLIASQFAAVRAATEAASFRLAAKHQPTRTLTFTCAECGFQGFGEAWAKHIAALRAAPIERPAEGGGK